MSIVQNSYSNCFFVLYENSKIEFPVTISITKCVSCYVNLSMLIQKWINRGSLLLYRLQGY